MYDDRRMQGLPARRADVLDEVGNTNEQGRTTTLAAPEVQRCP